MLTETEIPAEFMLQYCNGRGTRTSLEAVKEINSSTAITSVNGGKKMNQFQYNSLPLEDRPNFMSFQFNEQQLEEFIIQKIPDRPTIVDDLALKLTNLRSIIYKVASERSGSCWTEIRIQAFMALFLNYTFKAVGINLAALDANGDPISYTTSDNVTWNGHPDLKCCDPNETLLESATATIEMKVSMRQSDPRLFHSKALKPKQQLLCQALALLKGHSHTLSYLTDIFAISVMYYVKGKACLSARVTDARMFCVRLLLMCSDVSAEDWDTLLSPLDMEFVHITDEDDNVASTGGSNIPASNTYVATARALSAAPLTCSQRAKKCDSGHSLAFDDYYDDQEARDHRLTDITNYRRWEAKVLGHTYFGNEELQKCNEINENNMMQF